MPAELHETSLIAAAGHRLRAGIAVRPDWRATAARSRPSSVTCWPASRSDPFTPGFVADSGLAAPARRDRRDPADVRRRPAFLDQGSDVGAGHRPARRRGADPHGHRDRRRPSRTCWGWTLGEGLVFGLSLSVASTVVLLRALEERNALQSSEGKIAVGWLIVEDLAMVLALVLLPALAGALGGDASNLHVPAAASSTVAGTARDHARQGHACSSCSRWSSAHASCPGCSNASRAPARASCSRCACSPSHSASPTARPRRSASRSRSARFSRASSSRSRNSRHQAGNDSLPLEGRVRGAVLRLGRHVVRSRRILLREPLAVLAVLAVIMVGKSLAAFLIVLAFRHPVRTALTVSASLAQIGEFSFILVGLGNALGLLPAEGAISFSPAPCFRSRSIPSHSPGSRRSRGSSRQCPRLLALLERRGAGRHRTPVASALALRDHAIVVGYGRVGGAIGPVLREQGLPFAVIERDHLMLARRAGAGCPDHRRRCLGARDTARGRYRTRASAGRRDAGQFPGAAHRRGRARAQSRPSTWSCAPTAKASSPNSKALGANRVVMGERELAHGMLEYALRSLGVPPERARAAAGRDAPVNPEGT